MKYYELDKGELKILKDFDKGELKSVKGAQGEAERFRGYAKATLSKPKNINIRISDRDLQRLKSIAAEKGLPYQTLISSLLHQYSDKE